MCWTRLRNLWPTEPGTAASRSAASSAPRSVTSTPPSRMASSRKRLCAFVKASLECTWCASRVFAGGACRVCCVCVVVVVPSSSLLFLLPCGFFTCRCCLCFALPLPRHLDFSPRTPCLLAFRPLCVGNRYGWTRRLQFEMFKVLLGPGLQQHLEVRGEPHCREAAPRC